MARRNVAVPFAKEGAWGTRRYACNVVCGTLLEDGCFAFVLQREHADLRTLIERKRISRPFSKIFPCMKRSVHSGPFSKEISEIMMYEVALGMDWLHRLDIVHRDLKPANVLVREEDNQYYCFVADYECSNEVVGTEFFRAPEILQASKDRILDAKPEVFSKEADVYSFGMTCYEILTGKRPFEGHPRFEYDLVLQGPPLEIPEYVDPWMRDLLRGCWQSDPTGRPSFERILASFSAESAAVQGISSIYKFVPRWQLHWSHPKTEFFTHSQLVRQMRAVANHTARPTEVDDEYDIVSIEEQIERFESHRSMLATDEDDALPAEEENLEVFKSLQRHPKYGDFFRTFGEGIDDVGEIVIGRKFAQGGQGGIYEAHVQWRDPMYLDEALEGGRSYALKVLGKGNSLRDFQLQWPEGLLRWYVERREYMRTEMTTDLAIQSHACNVVCGTLLEDGRFAFLFPREVEDLRQLIDRRIRTARNDYGPFSKQVTERIMRDVALGMNMLHGHGIIHRDLKTPNVLIRRGGRDGKYQCLVADFDSSVGVIGTGFHRAPEILQACRDGTVSERPELFNEKVDVYSYGMTCYEILTGKHPFERYQRFEYDVVLNGQRPVLPNYVDKWVRNLLTSCWRSNPTERPSFEDILELFSAHSAPLDGDWYGFD